MQVFSFISSRSEERELIKPKHNTGYDFHLLRVKYSKLFMLISYDKPLACYNKMADTVHCCKTKVLPSAQITPPPMSSLWILLTHRVLAGDHLSK